MVTAHTGGKDNNRLALLSLKVVFWCPVKQQYIRHFFSAISEDVKEDTFHAWSYFRAMLLEVFLFQIESL